MSNARPPSSFVEKVDPAVLCSPENWKTSRHMRVVILPLLLLSLLASPRRVEALDCPIPPGIWSQSAASDEVSAEQKRRNSEDRWSIYRLERAPIIFRGRVVSARDLSDISKTNIPTSLLIFDRVEILKGRLFTAARDRKAFVISERWCDGSCAGRKATADWLPGKFVGVAAYPNTFADPSKAAEATTKRVVYRGRIDAMFGPCDGGFLSERALELLANPDEVARIKREVAPRRAH
ncbi:hypothetical protein [Bradyrhizobium nitroreducens]|uniref:hypothetical protein n=1 Tax=Bradyrhizobium nitroreducens TaxID=709803 RepID=UPI001374C21F|nr:hypothetical protein [Bradyrhizobium nitroreducens]